MAAIRAGFSVGERIHAGTTRTGKPVLVVRDPRLFRLASGFTQERSEPVTCFRSSAIRVFFGWRADSRRNDRNQ